MAKRNKNFQQIFSACLLAALCLTSKVVFAHPLAPSLLEITETAPGRAEVTWKIPTTQVPGEILKPVFPDNCHRDGERNVQTLGPARIERWNLVCQAPFVGSRFGVVGISSSKANVILRLNLLDGRRYQRVLDAEQAGFFVPERERFSAVFTNYFWLGIKHILGGWDHLLFVFGLVLLVKGRRNILWTLTAFTLGHSVTLALATLGLVHIPPAPVEALIALSIVALAVELLRDQKSHPTFFHRYPWLMAGGFGLLHGLGFAGALAQVGLPEGEIPNALVSFNLGIESGQLLFVAVLFCFGWLARRFPLPRMTQRTVVSAYFIGSLASFWFFERLFRLFA